MSTTSPNFALVLATSSDVVAVDSHVANNFSTLDSVIAVVHTGTGQLKANLTLTTPVLVTPTISGNLVVTTITGSTGTFNTITATGGSLTVNSLSIGTYALPSTIGATGALLTVVTGNAVYVAPSGGTGANTGLSNLAAVAINTSLGTFSAGLVTVDKIIATSGLLTGLTTFQATTGTFVGNLLVTGTLTAAVMNCTGGAGTFGSVTVGTWALPSTLASTGVLRSLSSTATWYAPVAVNPVAFSVKSPTGTAYANTNSQMQIVFSAKNYDSGNNSTTGLFTAPVAGTYNFSTSVYLTGTGNGWLAGGLAGIVANGTSYNFISSPASGVQFYMNCVLYASMSAGATAYVYVNPGSDNAASITVLSSSQGVASYFAGHRLADF